ncbi:putative quinol monooxygenase [[Limnothrix rosea] IAM M-220]|uniref:putative quinol monooxygenase n=1 Tax=[Limnothrix rosea] IAM M-220 TaxID=454133 RepID=UPI0009660115|nr:hypothetical protein [[Limnothrix rosea] IAM M-220]OKH19098.1 hypothetical protein NIES208_03780 [[Limnothrix rosea] IAM M-220]
MATADTTCSVYPHFNVPQENLDTFLELCKCFVEKTKKEQKCLHYGFSVNGSEVRCREAHSDAEGVLFHLANTGGILNQALEISELVCLEVHGSDSELAKLKAPLQNFNVQYFSSKYEFWN